MVQSQYESRIVVRKNGAVRNNTPLLMPKLRFGYAYDETPQPDAAVGAFLADSSRNTVSVGAGLDWLDVAFSWVTYDQRIVTSSQEMNGNYRANGWVFTMSATK